MDKQLIENEQGQETIDLLEVFYKLAAHWKWFLIATIVALLGAYLYVRFSTPVYQATASIVVKDTEGGAGKDFDQLFESMGAGSLLPNDARIEDEMEILQSRSILTEVVNNMVLHTAYFQTDGLFEKQLFAPPIKAVLDAESMDTLRGTLQMEIKLDDGRYKVESRLDDETLTTDFADFPAFFKTPAGWCTIYLQPEAKLTSSMRVLISRPSDVARGYSRNLSVSTTTKKTSIINLTYKDSNKRRAKEFLAELIKVYNDEAIGDKNKVTGNTLRFLEDRLDSISHELGFVERRIEQYKENQNLSDLKVNMGLDLTTNNEYEKQLLEVETQLNMTTYIYNFLMDQKNQFSLAPINTGVADTELSAIIGEYNKEVLERERLLHTVKADNPAMVNQNIKVEALRRNVLSSVTSVKDGLNISRENLVRKTRYFNSRIGNIPKQEREFNNIDRQQQIKASLYLMLLEKREQAAISLAATMDKARIIDAPLTADIPVAPRRMLIYAGTLLLLWLLTAAYILFGKMFNTKIISLSEVENTQIPVMGVIPIEEEGLGVAEGQNGFIEESFRRLRTNLRFMTDGGDKKSILVTSTTSGEGKSYVSINLAMTLALLGKKVLLVGLDVRKPRLSSHFHLDNSVGMTSYLSGTQTELEKVIQPSGVNPQLFVTVAGPVPPNPAELLERSRLEDAFAYFRQQFDYIVVDSAPVGLVSDTITLSRVTDFTLFVCRINYSQKGALMDIKEYKQSGQLGNVALVVNGGNLAEKKYGYGYKYGYRYNYSSYKDTYGGESGQKKGKKRSSAKAKA
ncbi:MAG: polysaccharide biosynthesis tyrosine autokinase [Prevotellaceae bacterium]|nr:polysaccharide biosynthesis tyrosine autokinase [Prevotellaceae bacterium]